ncbi:MAG: DUF4364 family protein [Oscillospiraceae bacterium]|jgi:hypothetical protein|nr:DUF4364 family protein [Oscillospiraceae bacterium]
MNRKRQTPAYIYEHSGFVHTEYDIKCLLLYTLDQCNRWVNLTSITDITLGADRGFTYFDMIDALTSLIKLGLVDNNESAGQYYRLSDKGAELNEITRRDVEFTVRRAVRKLASRRYFEDILLKNAPLPKELENEVRR